MSIPRSKASPNSKPADPSEKRVRRVIPEYQPFPLDALPPVMRQMVDQVGQAVGCDPAFAALPALSLAGACVAGSLVVSPKRGYREPPILFSLVVGDSGTGKSPGGRPFERFANKIESELREKHIAECVEAQNAAMSGDDGDDKPKPVREYFLAADITIERLIENLQSSPRGMFLYFPEAAQWFQSFCRYKGKAGGSDASYWLSMFDADPISYQRKLGPNRDVYVRRAAVSICGGIQPDILRSLLGDEYIASGLAARILFAMPAKHCPRWSEVELDQDTEDAFQKVLSNLHSIPFDPQRPGLVRLEHPARNRFIEFSDGCQERAEDLDGGPMGATLPKMPRVALRLALIHHAVLQAGSGDDPGKHSLTDTSMSAGITLAQWFIREAERVYTMFSESDEDRDSRRLEELIRRKGGRVSVRDLQRADQRRWPTQEAAMTALDELATAGRGKWTMHRPDGAGRPTAIFQLSLTPAVALTPDESA